MQSVPITSNATSSKHAQRGVLDTTLRYVMKFFSDLRQVSGFLQALCFPPSIKLTATICNVTEIVIKPTKLNKT